MRKSGFSIRSIFYRLLLSYSLVGTLPLAVACLVLLVWGNTLVVRYVQNLGNGFTERVAEEVDETVLRFQGIGMTLAEDPAVLLALEEDIQDPDERIELDMYQRIFREIRGYLSVVEVHLSSSDGMRKYSSTEYPRRYDLTNHQVRETYLSGGSASNPGLYLSPGPGTDGHQIVFCITLPLPGGLLFLDVRAGALESPRQTRTSSRLFLVDRRQINGINLIQPQEPASFSVYPELGIIFDDEYFRQPEPYELIHRRDLAAENLSVIMRSDLRTYFDTLRQILLFGLALVAGTLVITAIISIGISRSISRPIDSIIGAMTSNPRGPQPLPSADSPEPRDELGQLSFHYNRMVETISSLIDKVREEEQLLRLAERRLLQAQIQPHFLYNTLGSVKSMAKLGDFEAVSAIVTDLGKILRFSLSDTEVMVPLKEITDLIRRYLNIHKMRFQERMHFIMDLDPKAETIRVPKLIIQPLAENAVIHGVEKSPLPVTITLVTRLHQDELEIRVEDTGPGPELHTAALEGHGIGLGNVEKRLRLIYGEHTEFTLSRETGKTIARVRISQ